MSDVPATADATNRPGPQPGAESRSAGLISLVRKLIDFGRGLVDSLQQINTPLAPFELACRFNTASLALIIARITRGLRIATALEDRLVRGARRLDAPPRPARPRKPSGRSRPERHTDQPWPDHDPELRNLPSAKDIAERIRHRQVGAVIAEICRDLGIGTDHPLWRDIQRAVIYNGGNVMKALWDRWGAREDLIPPFLLAPPGQPYRSPWDPPPDAAAQPP